MSALRSIDVTQPPGSGATVQVPKSYMPEMDRALLDASPRILDFPASSGSFVPNSLSQILIPPSANRYILGGTAYLNFDITAIATGLNVPFNQAVVSYFTGGPTKSCAALIDRVTITAAGTTIADISNYYIWHNMVLLHAANEDYKSTSEIMENAFSSIDFYSPSATGNQTSPAINLALPLAVGVFNTTKAFPLWAFNGPLVINIYWASAARSIGSVGVHTGASYGQDTAGLSNGGYTSLSWSGSALSFRCLCTDVDPEYIMEQKKQMMGGKLLVYQYDQAMGMQTSAGSASINFGINCSSLLGVLGAQLMNADATQNAPTAVESLGGTEGSTAQPNSGSWGFSANDTDSIRVFRDGTQMTSFPLMQNRRDDAFPILASTLGILFSTSNGTITEKFDYNRQVPACGANEKADMNVSTLGTRKFNLPPLWGLRTTRGGTVFAPAGVVWGVPSRKCSDDNISNQGIYCQQLQLVVDRSTNGNVAGTHYLFYIFSSALAIDASGNCVVKR